MHSEAAVDVLIKKIIQEKSRKRNLEKHPKKTQPK